MNSVTILKGRDNVFNEAAASSRAVWKNEMEKQKKLKTIFLELITNVRCLSKYEEPPGWSHGSIPLEDFHVVHHHSPSTHWTDAPAHFEANREKRSGAD